MKTNRIVTIVISILFLISASLNAWLYYIVNTIPDHYEGNYFSVVGSPESIFQWKYRLYNRKGETVYEGDWFGDKPEFELLREWLVKVELTDGTSPRSCLFYNTNSSEISQIYEDVACYSEDGGELVAYFEREPTNKKVNLIICEIFAPENRCIISREFSYVDPAYNVEFLNYGSDIYVNYNVYKEIPGSTEVEYDKVEEIIHIGFPHEW